MIAAIGTWFAGKWASALPWLIGAAVIAVAALGLVSKLLGAGRATERADAATAALRRTREAQEARARASQPISPEEESRDPQNRDHR